MKNKKLVATLALSALLFTGCGLKSGQTIIKVNDKNITQAQFDKEIDKQAKSGGLAQMGIDVRDPNNSFVYTLLKQRIVNDLIVKVLLDEEVAKRNITVSQDDVNNAIKEIIKKVGSKEQLEELLKQHKVSNDQFKKDLKEQVKMKKLAETLGSSEVSDAEIKDFYKKNIDRFKYPEKVRASHILISVNNMELEETVKSDPANKEISDADVKAKVDEMIKQKENKAKELYAKLKADPSKFTETAKSESEDMGSAPKGGDLGFFAKKDMVEPFAEAAFKAKPNTVVGPVKTQYGYHIILVKDRMAAGQEPLEKVKNNIKEYLQNQKQVELIDNLVESLKKNAKIEYVNEEYDPAVSQKKIQEDFQKEAEAQKAKNEAPKAPKESKGEAKK